MLFHEKETKNLQLSASYIHYTVSHTFKHKMSPPPEGAATQPRRVHSKRLV